MGHFGSSGSHFVRTTSGTAHGTRGHSGGDGGRALRVPFPPAPFLGGHRFRVLHPGVVLREEGPQPSSTGRSCTCSVATSGQASFGLCGSAEKDCAGLWKLGAVHAPQRANVQA